MRPPDRLDPDDPFGTRPDEKPPTGWDDAFWSGVCERITEKRTDPRSGEPPPPPRQAQGRRVVIGLAIAVGAVAALAAFDAADRRRSPEPDAGETPWRTVVRVSGEQDPAVAVEWARRDGRRAGFVILESYDDPAISYILIGGSGAKSR